MDTFFNDVIEGLTKKPKSLSSKYFYDATGDALFQKIMEMPEYYLPACEKEIIANQTQKFAQLLGNTKPIEVIELGAGDGSKTVKLLQELDSSTNVTGYYALDISPNILEENQKNILEKLPKINTTTIAGNYFDTFPPVRETDCKRLILFLGSNIGNFTKQQIHSFFEWMSANMLESDALLVAFDLKKDPEVIKAAYNDAAKITARFNKNLLNRINSELGADFDVAAFEHCPTYNPETGEAQSFLVSNKEQTVTFPDGQQIHFDAFETLFTERSKKFSLTEIAELKSKTLDVTHFLDKQSFYSLSLFVKTKSN